jgi:hypothetical protein
MPVLFDSYFGIGSSMPLLADMAAFGGYGRFWLTWPFLADTAFVSRHDHFRQTRPFQCRTNFLQNQSFSADKAVLTDTANFSHNSVFFLAITAYFSHYRHNRFRFCFGMICKKLETIQKTPRNKIFDWHGSCLCGE